MINSSSKRIEYIDLAKGICILSVLFYHCNYSQVETSLDVALRSFRMPFYYFLSGIFFKLYDGFTSFTVRKVNKILIPFFFFYIGSIFLGYICDSLGFYEKGIIGDKFHWSCIWDMFTKRELTFNAPIWFFLSLFEANLLFYFLKMISKGKDWLLIVLVIVLGLLGFYNENSSWLNIPLNMFLTSTLYSMPFFVAGYYLNQFSNLLLFKSENKRMLLTALFFAVIVYLFAPDPLLKNPFQYYGIAFFGIASTLLFCKLVVFLPVVSYLGRYSLVVLGTHTYMVLPVRFIYARLFPEGNIHIYLTWISVALLSVPVIIIFTKLFPYFVAQKDLIKPSPTTK